MLCNRRSELLYYFILFTFFAATPLASFASQIQNHSKLTAASCELRGALPIRHIRLDGGSPSAFGEFFSHLPLDQYLVAKGSFFRRRCFSRFQIVGGCLTLLAQKAFQQSREVNHLFADVPRIFAPLDPGMMGLPSFEKLIMTFVQALPGSPSEYEIGVHQIRVTVDPALHINRATPVPEGRHKDGVDYIGIYVVNRTNVNGAITFLSTTQTGIPFFQEELKPGELLVVDDREIWHDATPIESLNGSEATRDVFIFTAERAK